MSVALGLLGDSFCFSRSDCLLLKSAGYETDATCLFTFVMEVGPVSVILIGSRRLSIFRRMECIGLDDFSRYILSVVHEHFGTPACTVVLSASVAAPCPAKLSAAQETVSSGCAQASTYHSYCCSSSPNSRSLGFSIVAKHVRSDWHAFLGEMPQAIRLWLAQCFAG